MLTRSDYFTKIGEQVREELFPNLQGLRIAWLESNRAKKKGREKVVFADCRKASEQYAWCCDFDYIITVYAPNVAHMTANQIKILLEHELMHIDFGDGRMGIRPHDAEEFAEIIRKYGIDWAK